MQELKYLTHEERIYVGIEGWWNTNMYHQL